MLTPRFKLRQDDKRVYVTIHAPYTSIADTEVAVDGDNLLFVSSPYFLRLSLPGRILEEDETAQGVYRCETGDFELSFLKETEGEFFSNLDMITSLLAPREIPDLNPSLIESLENEGIVVHDENDVPRVQDALNFPYGFGNKITADFDDIGNEFPHIFQLRVPNSVSPEEREDRRLLAENNKFSPDHYLADFYEKELIEPVLNFNPHWVAEPDSVVKEFTDTDIATLKELPNKSFILTQKEINGVWLNFIDIMYAYCYDKHSTMNDSNVESGWTINTLSATLSWFATFNNIRDTVVSCYRRALIYPIYRNFDLCKKVHEDLVALLSHGKVFVVKCMLDIYQMFNKSDARYILNQLYIKDYLIYLQKCSEEDFVNLINQLLDTTVDKDSLDLELLELEEAADLVQQEELLLENEMAHKMASMSLIYGNKGKLLLNNYSDSSSDDSDISSDSSDDSSSTSETSPLDSDDETS